MTIARSITEDDMDAVADLTARVFGNADDRESIFNMTRFALGECPFMRPDLCFIAEVDGRVVAKWQVLDLEMRVGRTPLRMGGIQAVVAEPDENHKGYPRQIAEFALPELLRMGFDLLPGFAQRGGFYRKLGAVPIMAEYELQLDARSIRPLRDDPFREFTDADLPELIDWYNCGNENRSGSMVRTTDHWPWMMRRPPVIHVCDDGYIGVRYGQHALEIREVAGRDEAFHDLALRKMATLARKSGLRKIRGAVPADHPLVEMAIRYGATIEAQYTTKSGCLALPLAPLRMLTKLQGELDSRLRASRYFDAHVDLGVRCAGQETRILLNEGGQRAQKIDLTLSAGSILQLAFGYRSVRSVLQEESTRGDGDPAAHLPSRENIDVLEAIFPQGHPFMWQTDRY